MATTIAVSNCAAARCFINSLTENGYLRASQLARRSSLFRDEVAVLLSLSALVSKSDGFVDIGANVGVFSSVIARVARLHSPNYSVHAFEVDPATFRRLSVNAERNGFVATNVGIAAEKSVTKFVRGAVSHVTTLGDKPNAYSIAGETFEARCAPLSEFDIAGNSLIIKIDVEGQELSVLEGCEPLFQSERVLAVYIDGYDDDRVLPLLTKYGFQFRDGRSLEPSDGRHFSLLAVHASSNHFNNAALPN